MLLRMAWRNLWRNPRRTGVLVAAVSSGVAGALCAMALTNGMVVQMVDTAIRTDLGHLQIHARGFDENPSLGIRLLDGGRAAAAQLEALEGVRAWAPRVKGEGLVYSTRASVSVRVLGIDPRREADVSVVAGSVVRGAYLDGARRRVLIGEALARRLRVDVGDKVVLSVQDLTGDLTGEAFRVGGLFRTASSEFDRWTLFVTLREGQELFGLGGAISELVVLADRRGDLDAMKASLGASLGSEAEVLTWEEQQPLLRQMRDMLESVGVILYAAVFIAMAFGIANVMLMAVHERTREIGILMAVGMKAPRVVGMVTVEAVIATMLGLALGFAASGVGLLLAADGIDLRAFAEGLTAYGIGTHIVPVLLPKDVWVPVELAFVTALVASIWPALRAARLRPADAVRTV